MSTLHCQPVRRDRWPQYPTRFQVQADPGLLRRHVPAACLTRRGIAAALVVVLASSAAGCASAARGSAGTEPAHVAPVFVHGDGYALSLTRPTDGAPIYLSKNEGLLVIADELMKAGLIPSARDVPLESVIVRGRKFSSARAWVYDQPEDWFEPVVGPLVADLADTQRRIYVEYVTPEDFYILGGDDGGHEWADLKQAATLAGGAVAKQGHGIWFGAFYDPLELWYHCGPVYNACSEELLRAQVQDFVGWLKAQGAI